MHAIRQTLRVTKYGPLKWTISINKNQPNLNFVDNFKMNAIHFDTKYPVTIRIGYAKA